MANIKLAQQFCYKVKNMRKSLSKLIVAVESKASATKRSSKTIGKYINKVPCSKQQLQKPTEAALFVSEQMSEYPLPPKTKQSKREQLLSEKIKLRLQQNQKTFNELLSKLEDKLTFLEVEQMRELLQLMNDREIIENKIGLRKLKNTVHYFLESSQQNTQIQDHIMEAAKKLIEEIKEAQKKRVNQIV